jgi:hypothetical protein
MYDIIIIIYTYMSVCMHIYIYMYICVYKLYYVFLILGIVLCYTSVPIVFI